MRVVLFGLLFSNAIYIGWGAVVEWQKTELVGVETLHYARADVLLVSEAAVEELRYLPAQASPQFAAISGRGLQESYGYCAEIGPFKSLDESEGFVGANSTRFAMTTDVRRISAGIEYRVYLLPFASRELAVNALEGLRAALAENSLAIDSLLIDRGELTNGIALGLFAEQMNALNVQAQLSRLGHNVVIAEVGKFREEYWVLVFGAESKEIFDAHWREIQLSRPYVRAGEKLCETIAHGLQFP